MFGLIGKPYAPYKRPDEYQEIEYCSRIERKSKIVYKKNFVFASQVYCVWNNHKHNER